MRAALAEREGPLRYPIVVTFVVCCASPAIGARTRLRARATANPIRRMSTPLGMAPGSLTDLNYGRWVGSKRRTCHFSGGCAVSLSLLLSLFSCLARLFGDRRGSTHPRIFDRFTLPELVIFQEVCGERLSISLFLALR